MKITDTKVLNKKGLYTLEQLKRLQRFKGVFLYVWPRHYDYWNSKLNTYETVFEVRGISEVERENYETIESIEKSFEVI